MKAEQGKIPESRAARPITDHRPPTTVWFAWALLALYLLLQIAAIILAFLGRSAPTFPNDIPLLQRILIYLPGTAAFPIVGALIAVRHPRNAIGWFFLCDGILSACGNFAESYWNYALWVHSGGLPGTELMLWVNTRPYLLSVIFDLLIVLCFPTGRPPSRRWWVVGGCVVLGTLMTFIAQALTPGVLDPSVTITNPLGLPAAANVLQFSNNLGIALLLVGVFGTALSLVVRFRQTRGIERQQIKLFAAALVMYAVAIGVVLYYTSAPSQTLSPMASIAFVIQALVEALVAVAAGIAITRYRLFDIDIIIRRTLVYSALTLTLGAIYVVVVIVLQALFRQLTGETSTLAVVASTLVIAALFVPARRRIQNLIDRRFYRRKYDARQVLEAFALRAQKEADIEALAADIISVVQDTLQPEHVRLWLCEVPSDKVRG